MPHRFFGRFAADRVRTALKDTPVVMVTGPRQSGKTTLVRDLLTAGRTYVTLDADSVLAAARADPAGFIRGLGDAAIDEVQRAPDLLRAIKRSVDTDRRPGRFLLTGSANVLALPTVSESLAGRMEIVTLLPLSQSEVLGKRPAFLRKAFAGRLPPVPEPILGEDLVRVVLTGGYPEMLRRRAPARRRAWARDYLQALLQRDVPDLADIDRLDEMSRLVRVLAHFSGQLANFTEIGGRQRLDDKTAKKYVGILEQLYVVRRLEPWFGNRLKRLVKTPKLHFLDSGLLGASLGITAERLARDRTPLGALLEAFVLSEVLKQSSWGDESYSLSHYRDKDQDEVDLVIEDQTGQLVGLEVKASATLRAGDFRGLRKLEAAMGKAFKLGAVLYDGDQVLPFGDRLFAAPISCLWG